MRLRFLLPLLAASPLFVGCSTVESIFGGNTCTGSSALEEEEKEPGGIHGFASEGDLDSYVADIEAKNAATAARSSDCDEKGSAYEGSSADAGAASGKAAPSEPDNESVTNNQEAGVDEGGIVKNIGDHLVVLRKGRLYVADVADGKAPSLADSMRVARTESLNSSVWYDEMLVKGDLVYVIGFRYGVAAQGAEQVRGATEIDTFRLTNGKLARLSSMFLESNDYYSGHNYASRMVNGKLVFYMPHYIGRGSDKKLAFPRVLKAGDDGKFSVIGPIFGALDVSTSLTKPRAATFHTVVQCDLPESGDLGCHGKSVIGSWWRETYVSPSAVYLWASSHVYRFDFNSLDVTSHTASGAPVDQFSFRESQDKLLVAVNSMSAWDKTKPGGPAMLTLPLAAFDKKGEQASGGAPLRDKGFISKNRFVGDVLVASVGDSYDYGYGYGGSATSSSELVTLDAATGKVQRASTSGVVRLEPLGERRVLVVNAQGSRNGSGSLALNAYSVDAVDKPLATVAIEGASQGEGRSHGFFFKPATGGGGTIGYAIVNPPGQGGSPNGWGNGISNLGFFDVAPAGTMSTLGIVSAGDVGTECEASCTDWYGNTRPIFLRERAFALMGNELAEVAMRPQAKRVGNAVILVSNANQ